MRDETSMAEKQQTAPLTEGLPPHRSLQSLLTDPREWQPFQPQMLVEGQLREQSEESTLASDVPSTFRTLLTPAGTGGEFDAEPGRYHLLVSGTCPWASGCRTLRSILGLEEAVSLDVVDGQSSGGPVWVEGLGFAPFEGRTGPVWLYEAYLQSNPACTSHITVPVLWDKKTCRIINNDSMDIMRMLGTVFQPCASRWRNLFPKDLENDEVVKEVDTNLNHGVYRAAVAQLEGNMEAHRKALHDVFSCLDMLETRLGRHRFICGSEMTYFDVRVMMTLLRFDVVYYHAFGCNSRRLGSYRNICGYMSDMYASIHPDDTVDWPSFYHYYRSCAAATYPKHMPLPQVSLANFQLPHDRASMVVRGTRRLDGLPIPSWFKEDAARAFRAMELQDSDVVLCTHPKCGTTLMKLMLICVLRLGPEGELPEDPDWKKRHPMYCETWPVVLPEEDAKPPYNHMTFDEVWVRQPTPRLLLTHTDQRFLPQSLNLLGKLVVVMRNPKDACTSLYYMFGVPSDGWMGAYQRYFSDDCPTAFGSWLDYTRNLDCYVRGHLGGWHGKRAFVAYFEDMVRDPETELERLAKFLEIPLMDKKKHEILKMTSFQSMKESEFGAAIKGFYRKGEIGDWRRHFLPDQSQRVDAILEKDMQGVELAAPYLRGGRLADCMAGDGTSTPCWLEPDHEEQLKKQRREG